MLIAPSCFLLFTASIVCCDFSGNPACPLWSCFASSYCTKMLEYLAWCVEKSVFSIWVDLFLCRSTQLLVLSYTEMFVYMYLSQLMSTFTNYHKGVSSSRWCLHSMTRRTSDPTITHIYLYTRVPQI